MSEMSTRDGGMPRFSPIILNGIEDIVARPDLADRSIFLTLEPIPDGARRTAKELWRAFDAEAPRILGALLDAVSCGIERMPMTELERIPRMADFAVWATACEAALWPDGTFMSAYAGNIAAALDSVVEADPSLQPYAPSCQSARTGREPPVSSSLRSVRPPVSMYPRRVNGQRVQGHSQDGCAVQPLCCGSSVFSLNWESAFPEQASD